MSDDLDPRLYAFRDDLADQRLEGQVRADRYVDGKDAVVASHFADVLSRPDPTSGLNTQFLHGQQVVVFETRDGWSWIQNRADGYVGYTKSSNLTFEPADTRAVATHMVVAPRTFLYSNADLKSPRSGYRSMGSKLVVVGVQETRGTQYAMLSSGDAVIAGHLTSMDQLPGDPVAIAETLLHAPYLWGGNTGFGLDCSGLVQLSHMVCGAVTLRDSDMLAGTIGDEIEADFERLQRGDLVFWKGHVGVMADGKNLLHANGHTMNVAVEDLQQAISRIGYLYGQPTIVRRPHPIA